MMTMTSGGHTLRNGNANGIPCGVQTVIGSPPNVSRFRKLRARRVKADEWRIVCPAGPPVTIDCPVGDVMTTGVMCPAGPPVTINYPAGGVDMPVLGKSAPAATAGPLSYRGGGTKYSTTMPPLQETSGQKTIQRSSGARTCIALCSKPPDRPPIAQMGAKDLYRHSVRGGVRPRLVDRSREARNGDSSRIRGFRSRGCRERSATRRAEAQRHGQVGRRKDRRAREAAMVRASSLSMRIYVPHTWSNGSKVRARSLSLLRRTWSNGTYGGCENRSS